MRIVALLLLLLALPAHAAETLKIAGVCPGMSPDGVRKVLGAPPSRTAQPEFELWRYPAAEITFGGVPLRLVSVQGSTLHRGGKPILGAQSTQAQVTKALGKPGTVLSGAGRPRILMYPKLGLAVTLRPGAVRYTLTTR